jgi:protein TonB
MSGNKSQALNAAKQYVLQRNVQAAVEIYRAIIEADPTDLTAINTLGDLYASAGRTQEAMAQFSRVADSYIEGGLPRKAIATLKKIIAVDPANTETATKLADLYAQAGLPSEARQHYLQIAEALTRKGQTLDALSVYSKIVELDPSNTTTRIKLGELYLREGMNEQAYEAFVTAAEHLAGKGENRRALNAYNEALAIRPDGVEVLSVARKLMTLLGVADPDRSLRSPASRGAASGDLGNENSSPPGSDLRRPSTPLDQASQSSDSFVVQEISKAERLVAYGQVNQAISMLRNVVKDQADSIDVHIKLKDIYLRTGMMAEAATECRELERIHEARGESDRARDYAVRAGRLTQLIEHPSGDLPEPERKPAEEVEPRVNAAPLKIAAPQNAAPKTRPFASRLDARPAQASRMTISVIPSDAPAVAAATTPAAEMLPASHSSPVEALPPVVEAELDGAPSRDSVLILSTHLSTDASARMLPALFVSSLPVQKKRGRLTAAAIAAAVFVLLGVSVVIGGFAYDAHLDKQYEVLALAAPPLAVPSPPPALVSEESEPVQENEPITVVVTPSVQTDVPAQRQRPEPEAIKNEPPLAAPQPVTEPPKVTTRPSPVLPRTTVSPDSHAGTENRTPLGVPVDVPIGATHPAEPPPKTVRRSPGVVTGSAVKKVDPVYPPAAREARQTGVVAVEVTISEQGNVTSARALSGPALLRNAAVLAARAWKFKASTLGGVPVTTTTTIVFNFKL